MTDKFIEPIGERPHFNFLLQPEFPLNALILSSDALRIANQNSGVDLFSWSFVSETGDAVRASNGMWFTPDCDIDHMPHAQVYLLFEGNLPTQHVSKKLLGALRMAARFGAMVGGVDTGAFALAQAGLIGTDASPDVALHWEAVPTFMEQFPNSQARNRIFLTGRNIVHCAGGVSTLDMTLALIADLVDEAMANEVANALVHTRREGSTRQREDQRFDTNPLAARLVKMMESNLDFPLALPALAESLGTSERTLARISRETYGESPMRLYLLIRLQAARNFLFYEEHSIAAIANACGFSYTSAFSRAFRALFGQTPSKFRAILRERQSLSVRPEIRRLISDTRSPHRHERPSLPEQRSIPNGSAFGVGPSVKVF